MGDKFDGGQGSLRGKQEKVRTDADSDCLGEVTSNGSGDERESIGASRAIRKGDNRTRPKPTTHGKTLSFLINLLANQVAESEEISRREDVKREQLRQQMQQLQTALEEWQESVQRLDLEDPA